MAWRRARKYHLEKIQPVTKQYQYRHKGYCCVISLGITTHQYQYRCNKIDNEHHPEDATINTLRSWFEVSCFFRDIRIPYQHELGEPEIGPENRKREHEFSEIMQVF